MKSLVSKRTALLGVVAAALAVAAAVAASSSWSSVHATASRMVPDTMRTPAIRQEIAPVANPTGTVRFTCQLRVPAGCYGPDQLRQAYGVQTLLNTGNDGSGRTIVIIDAFGSPTLATDVSNFDAAWGLPAADYSVITPYGVGSGTPDDMSGWAGEVSLDVEWAHAIAPGAKIDLVVSRTDNDSDILDATQYAIDHNLGDVISQSFGEAEQCMASADLQRQHALFQRAVQKGITLFASAGDSGAAQPTCDGGDYFKAASTPATDPNVTAVGGTDLLADGVTGTYESESTWNESAIFSAIYGDHELAAGGGGVSVVYGRPFFQTLAAAGSRMREVPDVSYNAAVFNGVIVAFGGDTCPEDPNDPNSPNDLPCYYRFGGTSAGSPQWAAIIAIVDEMAHHRVGNINPTLYLLGSNPATARIFHDVADGSNNDASDNEGNTIPGYTAARGYDMATGLGSPNIGVLAPVLAAHAPAAG